MPQNDNPESGKTRTQSPNEASQTIKLCHIHDKIESWDDKDEIRHNLCRHTKITEHTDGKHYCLFHLPTEDKNVEEFNRKFTERLNAVEIAIIEAKNLSEAEQEQAKQNKYYDFRYVYFPLVNLRNYEFIAPANFNSTTFTSDADFNSAIFTFYANFRSATFTSDADFKSATFTSAAYFSSATFTSAANFSSATFTYDAYFSSATFTSYADFRSATFTSYADFRSATFTSDAYFSSATFTSAADFRSATFTSAANFRSATFTSAANFRSATFGEKSQIYFLETKFCSNVYFNRTEIEGYVEFEGNIFLDKDAVNKLAAELENKFAVLEKELNERGISIKPLPINIEDGQEAILNLQSVRLRNPERVSFNSTKLRPNWFVNVDEARKIVFNDVDWLNTEIDIDSDGLEKELESLKNRGVPRRERSLIKACNQLADNAEANRRFEEAKQFRKNALALDTKIKCHVHFAVDANIKDDIREKVCRKYPVVNEDGGNYYCLWHNPDKNKAEIFLKEFEKHQADGFADFRAVTFPITIDYSPRREDSDGNLVRIPSPEELNFTGATFQRNLIFQYYFVIRNLNLSQAYFEEDADLDLKDAVCNGNINLDKAVFDGKLFLGKEFKSFFINPIYALSMKDVRFDKPQNANFYSVRLRPHYFVDADTSKFNFHDCNWTDESGAKLKIKDEIRNCGKPKTLAQVCNQLAVNYEENRDFEQSSYFRYTAMQSKRLEKGLNGWFWTIDWLYWLSSGYGERRFRAFVILISLISLFGILYSTHFSTFESVDNSQNEIICGKSRITGNKYGISVCHGIVHSLAVASFQRPEPKPGNSLTKFFVTLETILAPLQAALLALAIRRKFMR